MTQLLQTKRALSGHFASKAGRTQGVGMSVNFGRVSAPAPRTAANSRFLGRTLLNRKVG